jgi:hypothetical protein
MDLRRFLDGLWLDNTCFANETSSKALFFVHVVIGPMALGRSHSFGMRTLMPGVKVNNAVSHLAPNPRPTLSSRHS